PDVGRQRHEGAALDPTVRYAEVVEGAAVGDGVPAGGHHRVVLDLHAHHARHHLRVDVRLLQPVGDDVDLVQIGKDVLGDDGEVGGRQPEPVVADQDHAQLVGGAQQQLGRQLRGG